MQKLTWIGHGSWKLVTEKGTKLYVDPWIVGNPAAAIRLEDAFDADIVCVTHGHNDHLGDALEICKRSGAVLVTLPDIYAYAALHGIPMDDRGGALQMGGGVRQLDCSIRGTMALHASDIWGEEQAQTGVVTAGSGACGLIVEPDGGKSVYFAGDTGVFLDMQLIGELYKPYVAVLPVGDKYVMGLREAACAARLVGAPIVVPGHYDTFPAIRADMDRFQALCEAEAPHSKLVVLKPGASFEF